MILLNIQTLGWSKSLKRKLSFTLKNRRTYIKYTQRILAQFRTFFPLILILYKYSCFFFRLLHFLFCQGFYSFQVLFLFILFLPRILCPLFISFFFFFYSSLYLLFFLEESFARFSLKIRFDFSLFSIRLLLLYSIHISNVDRFITNLTSENRICNFNLERKIFNLRLCGKCLSFLLFIKRY